MQHLDEGTIHAWLDGALDTEDAARVERHAAECDACAAAVAEARGLVAGASRILSALDQTPGGVLPARSGSSGDARRGRALWRVLHVTPARAAAAAILFVAAGTVLVLRQRPNDALLVESEAGPEVPAPGRAAPRAQSQREARVQRPSAAPVRTPPAARVQTPTPVVASPRALPAPSPPREAIAQKSSAPALTPQTAPAPAPRLAELPRASIPAASPDSVSAKKAAGGTAGAPVRSKSTTASALEQVVATSAGARSRARSADVVAGAAPSPAAEIAPRFAAAPAKVEHVAGCYAIEADAAAGLPARILLDSARLERRAFAERAGVTDASAGPTYAVKAISASPSPAMDSYWQPTSDGGLRLSIGGQPPTSIDLHPISPIAFAGTTTIGDRQIAVTLQRLTDCPTR